MSQNSRATGGAESDADSVLNRAMVLMEEAEELEELELPPPAMGSDVQQGERMSSQWRKDTLGRILGRLRVTTSDLNHALKHPESLRLLSGKNRLEYPESERAELEDRVEVLKLACHMVRDDVKELIELYVPGKDSPNIAEVIETLKRQIAVLEGVLARF
ncbi:Hypothetical protein NCS54_00451000 [Fusarium falciforme]|uniref:Uncharacterized protein n=1 Tax=Fusarium falciforme TaxID=195108 RepID=A0A9W8QYS6_9HYPO|nr:Hypothetical protein NCS54_00451000 [Fusarium falciforme]KAJ4182739.1 hypothetical protein NW755_010236 [Fusarium falciforme]KAJ4242713.1 hypothetical protein NW757_011939 [Fusarium falciforme]WAO87207.1 Hypothetical protein NCS54_00451000 [Fusarium falciforme]